MDIYLVRHGKSVDHINNRRQSPTSKLSDFGQKQALAVGRKLKNKNIKILLSSNWERALETAKIIAQETNLSVKTHKKIHEFESNPILAGQPLDSDIVKQFNDEVKKFSSNFEWSFGGKGENMRDIINRAIKFKKEVTKQNQSNDKILVVTHGLFIATFITLCLLGENYNDADFKRVVDMLHFENGSITILKYDKPKDTWEIEALNDQNHLENLV